MGAGMNGETDHRDSVLPERLPGVERVQTTMRFGGDWSGRCPASQVQNPQEGEEGHPCWDLTEVREAHFEGPSYRGHLGEDREAEPVHHPRPARHLCPLLESWLLKKMLEMKQEVLQGLAGGEPCPLLWVQPSPVGSRIWEDKEAELPLLDFNLEPPQELGPEVDCFLQELAGSLEKDDRNRSSPEPPEQEYERWVTWQARAHDIPGWWPELAKIPGVDDHQEIAWKVQASFELPQQINEWHGVENYHQAPLALPCIHWKDFHSLIQSLPARTLGSHS